MLVYFGEAEQLQWEYQVRLWGEYTYPGDQNPFSYDADQLLVVTLPNIS